MKTLPLSEAKMKLSELVERVHAADEEIMITKNGRPAAVLVGAGEFESWKETIEILSSSDEIKRKIRAALELVASDPASGTSLQDELQGLESLRVGRLRVTYKEGSRGIIEVVAIGSRKVIYEETYRLLKKNN